MIMARPATASTTSGKPRHRAAAVIELAAAVIGDVDNLHAVIERDLGVLRRGDALERERDLEILLDALDGAPVERHLDSRPVDAAPAGGDVALGEIALAAAVMGGVDGEAERGVAVRDRALDMIVDPGFVAAHIELEDAQRIGRRLGDVFEAGIADRTQHVGAAEFGRRPDHRLGAERMKAFQRADRTQHDRQPQLAAEHFDEGSTLLTSRSTRGRNAIESSAIRLRRSVVSVSVPPTM
jgi:hypothetical protein